jgi:kynurenine formamidase
MIIGGYAHTHIDAFAHRFFDGKMYNGFSSETVTMKDGAEKNSIYNLHSGIVTRGILMDIPRLKGVPYLEPGTRIFIEDLEAWEKRAGTRVLPSDAVFVRTGRWNRRAHVGPWNASRETAGLDVSVIPWLKQRGVALLGSESAQDAAPPPQGADRSRADPPA